MTWFINTTYYKEQGEKFLGHDRGDKTVEEWENTKVEISERDLSTLADGLTHACEQIDFLKDEIKRLQEHLLHAETAESRTHALELHYKQVVRPVNEYCQAFYDWRDLIAQKVTDLKEVIELESPKLEELFPEGVPENLRDYRDEKSDRIRAWYQVWNTKNDLERWEKCLNALNDLYLFIAKSDYLRRRIYAKEPTRTEKCPLHQGRWSGIQWPGRVQEGCTCQDPDGNVSGWIHPDRVKSE